MSLSSNVKHNFTNYEMNVLVIYREDSESYKEVIQNYAQSLYVNTYVKAVSNTELGSEELKKYDLIYPDVSLIDANNREEIVDYLTDYVRNGGNLFLEAALHEIFSNDILGMSKIEEVNLTNQTFNFPIVPQKYRNLQKVWKTYSVKKRLSFYDIIRHVYHKFKRDNKVPAKYDIDLTKIDVKIHALPDTAISLVNNNGFSLLSVNNYGKGTVLWTVNHIPNRGTYFGKPFMTRLDLGYPDQNAKNFHFGYATINYLMRNSYLDFITKEKYGFRIQKVFGAYGRPSFSWQNHLDSIDVWENDQMIRWIDILKEQNQIPTFSVIRKPFGCDDDVLVSEHCADYAKNTPGFPSTDKIQRNVKYALKHSICISPHYYVGRNYTPEEERYELKLHKQTFSDMGISWTKTVGTNHHCWSVRTTPVWQTIYTEKKFGLAYDFGWETMAADFRRLYCTCHPYMPYGMPFLLMENDIDAYPFIMWTPNTEREYVTFDGKSGLFVFPSSFDLPITYYFHPEHAFMKTKKNILFSYLLSFLKYNVIPTKLDIRYSGDAYRIIHSFNKLRDEDEYNMMGEEQAAKAMLNMYYTKVKVEIDGSKLTIIPDTSNVPENAEEYKNTLGIKIELHPDFISKGLTTDSSIYCKPATRQIYLGLYKKTDVNLNERAERGFHLVRCNVPFTLNGSSDSYKITVKSAGMRQLKIFSLYPLKVKSEDVVFENKGNYYTITDYGDLNKTIFLEVQR